jgi:hypothetical protein
MSTKHLQDYLDQQNFWRAHQKKALYDIATLTAVQAQTIMDSLECSLSPENLSCDGELSRAQVNARYRQFTGAMKAIGVMFPQVRPQYDEWELF